MADAFPQPSHVEWTKVRCIAARLTFFPFCGIALDVAGGVEHRPLMRSADSAASPKARSMLSFRTWMLKLSSTS